ncbi:MAG TPA: L,D-transpeptidase, partial [Kaistia sp.]|nr:L,D-transpeptidase [Kaistia sp.]
MNETKPLKAAGKLSRRTFMIGLPVVLAACQTSQPGGPVADGGGMGAPVIDQGFATMYGPITDEPFPVGAIDLTKINPRFYRQVVNLPTEIN